MPFITEPLEKQHDRTRFSCGSDALDRYLKEQAGQDAKNRVASPFVYVHPDSGEVSGFYTLSAFSVEFMSLPPDVTRRLPRYPVLPSTLIGRFGVDRSAQGKGLGALLLADALRRSLGASRQIASVAVVVDAKDAAAASFYRRFAFEDVAGFPGRLFLPMRTIERLFTQPEPAQRPPAPR